MTRRLITAAALVVTAALASACGTGLQAKTYTESGRSDSGAATLGGIAVRNAYIDQPATGNSIPIGQSALLVGFLVNNSSTGDALVGASSPLATGADLQLGTAPAATVAIPPNSTVPIAGAAPGAIWSISLTGLIRPLRVGEFISVTLNFQNAGHATIQVPVRAGNNGLGSRTPDQNPFGSAG